jgi:O-antigen/teichoic acid export membrane protein
VTSATRAPVDLRFASALNSVAGLAVYGLSAITGPLLARALGPAGRGDYASVVVPAEMVAWVLAFGMPLAAVYYANDHDDRSLIMASWTFALAVGGVITACAWAFVPTYLHAHSHVTVPWLRAFLVMAIPFAPLLTATNLLMARGRVVAFNVLKQLALVLNTIFLVILSIAGRLSLSAALAAAFAGDAIAYLATLAWAKAWPGRGFRAHVTRLQIRYGARVATGSLANLLVSRLDQFVLVGAVSSHNLGLYAVAATGSGVSGQVSQGVSNALMPHLRNLDVDAHRRRQAGQAVRWTLAASVGIALVLALTARWGLPLLFGGAFRGAVPLLWILLVGQVANDVANVLSSRLQAEGKPGVPSEGLLVAVVVTVIGLAIAVGPYGVTGAAVVTVLSQFAFLGWVAERGRHRGRHAVAPRHATGG